MRWLPALLLLVACGQAPAPTVEPAVEPATVPVTPIIETVAGPADATAVAVPVVERTTTTTIDVIVDTCEEVTYVVNQLPFAVLDPEPVRTAYRLIAQHCRGWDEATIAKWERFAVDDVPIGEAVGCWNLRGGATTAGIGQPCAPLCPRDSRFDYPGCVGRQGGYEDTGMYQLIGLWYDYPNGILCASDGYCSSDAIIQSPFHSINAGLAAIEYDGKGPWCYNERARGLHWSCAVTPRHWP